MTRGTTMLNILTPFTFLLLLPTLLFAAPAQTKNQSIQLNKYYAATCANYTGTWRGFFTDPTDLFGNGGPWPVSVSLYNNWRRYTFRLSESLFGSRSRKRT